MIRALVVALAAARAAAAASEHVAYGFDTPDMFVEFGQTLPIPPELQRPTGSATQTVVPGPDGGTALRFDWEFKWTDFVGLLYFQTGNITGFRGCTDKSQLRLRYRVPTPVTGSMLPPREDQSGFGDRPGEGDPWQPMMVFGLYDAKDCQLGDLCFTQDWAAVGPGGLEVYTANFDAFADDSSEWRELRLGICGGYQIKNPWLLAPELGAQHGNLVLDVGEVTGVTIGVTTDPRQKAFARGAVEFADLTCIEPDEPVDPCAVDSRKDPAVRAAHEFMPDIALDKARAYDRRSAAEQVCWEMCAADPRCLYWMLDTLFVSAHVNSELNGCWFYDAIGEGTVGAKPTTPPGRIVESYWSRDPTKRGAICDVCACSEVAGGRAADCAGRDLATVPAFDDVTLISLDLSDNPRLTLIGPEAFRGLEVSLERLVLPGSLEHLSPEALSGLDDVDIEAEAGGNAIREKDGKFFDVCCSKGETVAGLTYCDLRPSTPTTTDFTSARMDQASYEARFGDLPVLDLLTRESPVFAEAAESVDKCVVYCHRDPECFAFAYSTFTTFQGRCFMYGAAPAPDAPAPSVFDTTTDYVGGLPPRARAAAGDRVMAEPDEVVLEEANGYAGSFDVFLGGEPLRGAVWVTPTVDDASLDVTFDPPGPLVFYNASERQRVAVSVQGVMTGATPTVSFDVIACDVAFGLAPAIVRLIVRAPPRKSSSSNNKAKRLRKQLVIAAIVVACVLGVVGMAWLFFAGRKFARRKAKLEADRAVQVVQQVATASDRVKEFQAHLHVVRGDAFLALPALKSHEELRDCIETYDTLQSVHHAAMSKNILFVFISHQWLGWHEPDPDGVHIASMKQAVRSVAADADVEASTIRVWVDVASIPQMNRSEQRLAINSLPTFASTCDYFVVVAPDCTHADTGKPCDARTYRSRAWCRAEIMSCWARNGTNDMYVSTNAGLRPLAANDAVLKEALDVFHGELTCCRLGHPGAQPCDREALMLPMLGLYAQLYAKRNGGNGESNYADIVDIKDTLYPKTCRYCYKPDQGPEVTEDITLFGDLVQAMELAVDLGSAADNDPLKTRAVPDFEPGTNAQPHAHHLRVIGPHGSGHATKAGSFASSSFGSIVSRSLSKSARSLSDDKSQGTAAARRLALGVTIADQVADSSSSTSRRLSRRGSSGASRGASFASQATDARPADKRLNRANTWRASAPHITTDDV